MPIALDATYSAGHNLTGVGVYCREILYGLASADPAERFRWAYRPHRFFRSWRESIPSNCSRWPLIDTWPVPGKLYHGLNQRLPRWRGQRSVTTFHDLFVLTSEYSSAEFRARFASLARDAAERSDLIIAVSSFTAEQVTSLLGVESGRLRVIHHGVHMPVPGPEESREPIVLHVGAIQKRKNTARLIEAFQTMPPPWRLVLAGSTGFGAEEILQRAGDRIEVSGYVTAAQLDRLYRRAAIFAFPSLDEGFGIPALEAMAYGIPVLASDTSALPEVCGDSALLINPHSVEAIADGLRRLAQDTELRNELKRRGVARAKQFTWLEAVNKTLSVYKELLR